MTDNHPARPGDEVVPRPTLEQLGADESMRLLEETPVGRLGFITEDGHPMILPVNHVIDGGDVAFRTTIGTKLDVAERLAGSEVVYEVDGYSSGDQTGWSVLVKGRIQPVIDAVRIAHLDRIGHHAWSDDLARDRWVLVVPAEVTGRRVVMPD